MMKRYLVIATAWLLQVASWFLPAVKGFLGGRLDHGIPGWAVFLSQTCALRPCGLASADPEQHPVSCPKKFSTNVGGRTKRTTLKVDEMPSGAVDCCASVSLTRPVPFNAL
jgi:hypothetical protein